MKKFFNFIAIFLIAASITGCARKVVVADHPNPPVETRPAPPRADYVWVDGDYTYRGGTYVWVGGHWDRPRSGRAWVAGHWGQRAGGWYWIKGHWN